MNSLILPSFAAVLALAASSVDAEPGCSDETTARNKAVARLVFDEILNHGRVDEFEHIYHPDFLAHGPTRSASRAEDREASKGWRVAAPDLRMDVLRIVGECDMVAVHWSASGTNTGAAMGLPGKGAKLKDLWGTTLFRLEEGRIREEWTVFDQYRMLDQSGLLGPPQTVDGQSQ